MQTKLTLISVAAMLALTACGGGSDNQVDNVQHNTTTDLPPIDLSHITSYDRQASSARSNALQSNSIGRYRGVGLFTTFKNIKNGTTPTEALKLLINNDKQLVNTSSSMGTIAIPAGGKPLHFGALNVYGNPEGSGTYQANAHSPSYKYFMMGDESYSSVQFAAFQTTLENNPFVGAFYRGNTTPVEDMPKSGIAKYTGHILFIPDTNVVNADFYGSAGAVVDFSDKIMELFIATNNYEASVPGVITGSTFVGRKDARFIEGMFAGQNAQELAGRYVDGEAQLLGVFGAKRTK